MSKGLIFFFCSCAILLFTIINLSIGPIVSKKVGSTWGTLNCQKARDDYKKDKDAGVPGDILKYGKEWTLNECDRKKGMHDMEYTCFIFNIVIGFVCGLLGLLHLLDVKKEFVSKTGLIGFGCGIVGFILSFVYVIMNGLVYTTIDTGIPKRNSDGVFAERIGTTTEYKCLYFDKPSNSHSIYATYSDLIQKQYNYDKDLNKKITDAGSSCSFPSYSTPITSCSGGEKYLHISSTCANLYIEPTTEITNKDKSDRFLTTLLLSLFVCLTNVGLAIFGFLLFRTPSEF